MPTFITPPGYAGTAELTASNGLQIVALGKWKFSQAGYNDGTSFGLSLGFPTHRGGEYSYGAPSTTPPISGEELHLQAQGWSIAVVGNALTSYTDPDTHVTYSASRCRIQIVGNWYVLRRQNSNSYNSIGIFYDGATETDLGTRLMTPSLLSFTTSRATYTIQGSDVTGGAQDTFSSHLFYCKVREITTSDNSNREYQSNTVTSPVFVYTYSKSWQTD